MRRAAKVDLNHGAIRTAFRAMGCTVFDASAVGKGFPDLVIQHGGITILVEVKTEEGKLTKRQEESPLMAKIVRNMDDVAGTVKTLRRWHKLICEGIGASLGAKKHASGKPIGYSDDDYDYRLNESDGLWHK